MNIFLSHRIIDTKNVDIFIKEFTEITNSKHSFISEREHTDEWKDNVKKKIEESDIVLFLVGKKSYESEPLKWEYETIKRLKKEIFIIQLTNNIDTIPNYIQKNQIISSAKQLTDKVKKMEDNRRNLLIEQYKIMVSSTEKVTEQRLKVNNLFFTVTTSLLSISILLGKSFGFTILALIGMIVLTILSILITYFWNKLIGSYGKLNTGKFELIAEIEDELKIDMFQREWDMLTKKIKYKPNTKTETKIITLFRVFIWLLLASEIIYLSYLLITKYC